MNGAVFQTSAKIITPSASGCEPSQTVSSGSPMAPSRLFTKPSSGSKIVCQVIAVTTVRIAHGTSTTVRRMPWPLKAACIAIAIATPRISSKKTEKIVKMKVCGRRPRTPSCRRPRGPACSCRTVRSARPTG